MGSEHERSLTVYKLATICFVPWLACEGWLFVCLLRQACTCVTVVGVCNSLLTFGSKPQIRQTHPGCQALSSFSPHDYTATLRWGFLDHHLQTQSVRCGDVLLLLTCRCDCLQWRSSLDQRLNSAGKRHWHWTSRSLPCRHCKHHKGD